MTQDKVAVAVIKWAVERRRVPHLEPQEWTVACHTLDPGEALRMFLNLQRLKMN